MPGRAAGQLPPLEQHHVAPPQSRQVIGGATADDAAADDDDPRLVGERLDHCCPPRREGWPAADSHCDGCGGCLEGSPSDRTDEDRPTMFTVKSSQTCCILQVANPLAGRRCILWGAYRDVGSAPCA